MSNDTVTISYGGENVTMTWDGADATAPILVDGSDTGRQTSSARHRRPLAVAIACKFTWPEVAWPVVSASGLVDLDPTDAWDEMSYWTNP